MCQKFITYCSFGFVRSVSLRKPYHYENGPLRVVALRTCWKSETFLLELIRKWKRPFRKEISTLLLGNNVTYVSTGKEWFELYGWEGFSCFAIQNSSSSTTACDCFSGCGNHTYVTVLIHALFQVRTTYSTTGREINRVGSTPFVCGSRGGGSIAFERIIRLEIWFQRWLKFGRIVIVPPPLIGGRFPSVVSDSRSFHFPWNSTAYDFYYSRVERDE